MATYKFTTAYFHVRLNSRCLGFNTECASIRGKLTGNISLDVMQNAATEVLDHSCKVFRGKDINIRHVILFKFLKEVMARRQPSRD